jgi:hypothetical protein
MVFKLALKEKMQVSRRIPFTSESDKRKRKKKGRKKKKTIKEIREYERSLNTYWASSEEQVDLEEYKKQEARKKQGN